ncbi:Calcium-binding EF hand family protein [Zostera marina]|uniref:Calcium-binding EF hand family protein n=1 Tax=Zostera marina TaxID=29655 RepID=A0A0K9P5D8_ZOSMR|nr:Calcium-binding EF hand family protein [Zostera marina]
MERKKEEDVFIVDGSEIEEMVGNEKVFSSYVDHKFQELDVDGDGKLSIQELQPAIADIGAALGLPPHGSSPDSDKIYSHVRSYFTRGKEEEEVSKTGFKGVLSDVLLGMAVGLNRHPIEILKLDGKLLRDYVESSSFEADAVSAFLQMEMETNRLSLNQCVRIGLGKLTVDLGMPPSSDSSVIINITGPAMDCVKIGDHPMKHSMQQTFVDEFRKVVANIAGRLEQHPVIVAHSEKTFDGSSVRRLLSDQTEFDKVKKNSASKKKNSIR